MDILRFHDRLLHNYGNYIRSFVNIKDPRISEFVDKKIHERELWPEPLIQFNPTFAPGQSLESLVSEKLLHAELGTIFKGYNLYKHQEEAIRLGAAGKEFIVTSGTGSGKSLTYLASIFNYILNSGKASDKKTVAVIVYPMNALINSQSEAIEKLKKDFGDGFPIVAGQFTGQENELTREEMRLNPPHILLTNYMMLELIMTRAGKDIDLRKNILDHIRYLVFDELHTYRGRQGADVAMLIRRIKAEASNPVTCIGTSATMVSNETSTLLEQKQEVARVSSLIFGSDIHPSQVVYEYLVPSITPGKDHSDSTLHSSIRKDINLSGSFEDFESHPTAIWLEENIALESKDGVLRRGKPKTITNIIKLLSDETSIDYSICEKHLLDLLQWANVLNSSEKKGKDKTYLPYRIHQFIAQTGSVYSTLGDQDSRTFSMDAGLYDIKSGNYVFPLVFSRTSGHEFYCINLDTTHHKLLPRDFANTIDRENEEIDITSGYLFIQHEEDGEPIWDEARDRDDFPESWFNAPRVDGTQTLKKERVNRIARKIYFDQQGKYSLDDKLEFEGWYIPTPLLFDPTSGHFFDHQTAEWTKLMKLGGEGRSTATTVLSFETITQLHAFDQSRKDQKLLSFTDNRQDASLQSGHFNDFIKVGQLRAAIVNALDHHQSLDYTNIADKVFDALHLSQEQYAKNAATFPGPIKENETAFKDFIMYRLLDDLKRSWRVVLPNLEQCALLNIEYSYLEETIQDESLWQQNELLHAMSPSARKIFLLQIFDFLRKAYALSFSMLERATIEQNTNRIKEKLKDPWTLEDAEKIEFPSFLRIEKLARTSYNLYSESGGSQSIFGRYIRANAKEHGFDLKGIDAYKEFVYRLLDLLTNAGWLTRRNVNSSENQEVHIYQLKVDTILWKKGDGETIAQDLIKSRSYRPLKLRANEYFKNFYRTNFRQLKPIEGAEHTGQINNLVRRDREEKFRKGDISALFCSPTMELGIDISELSIVHMRNVPPSPANYAQRSGRAGRSGQAALVMAYCSNFSSHDRHFFKQPDRMVAGAVSAPRMDLINEELLKSHLYAGIMTRKPLDGLRDSLGEIVDKENITLLPLKFGVSEALQLTESQKKEILVSFKKVMDDTYFKNELAKRRPPWFNDEWIKRAIDEYAGEFDKALTRWRFLYRNAILQFRAANEVIENHIYAADHLKVRDAKSKRRQAERQMDLLLNVSRDVNPNFTISLSEFYPYRYLASEGFLPGYGFTRLPLRSFMENKQGSGEFVSRPRIIAINEFGPRNVIYHDGAKYRIDRMILTETETRLEAAKISPQSGYIMMKDQYNYTVDPITKKELSEGMDKHIHPNLLEMAETKAVELQRITCQEEERTRKGYDTRTFFSVDGDIEDVDQANVTLEGDKLLHIHSMPAARLVHVNFKWKGSQEDGYALNLKNGYWQNKEQEISENQNDEVKRVKLFTSTTANAIYIQPVVALALEGGKSGVITLMYALKKAIENYFQVEAKELGVEIMGDMNVPNILLYEASEGSLGILAQMVENPEIYRNVMLEAFNFLFVQDGREIPKEELVPATYDDLLSYYNQHHHADINRNLIRESLRMLKDSKIEVITSKAYSSYDEHYQALQNTRDSNSSTEDTFLKYLYDNNLKLPDSAQPNIINMYVRPDFFYKPNVCIFCDGTPHDRDDIVKDDSEKRNALKNAGYQVLSWHYNDSLEEFVTRRPDIFRKVK